MIDVHLVVLVVLVALASWLGARVEHRRDARLVGILAIALLAVVVGVDAAGTVPYPS
ncbi:MULTISPECIES: hypothetical protein [unclassified Rhodococcus (in: high G+C Gram-positive bacteria)]|uniref:hypothetical protein n=1 Tax=unclassified Rhodococcus (in: high G+C Gram-positive bacteria) TaxID=192944 RepID=UPI000A7CD867|nr:MULTISPECIES: hypothetical protein [unclassified Rhodococcus (in: high G+C Gram-positive bacteria)]MDQ1179474.1 putative membrane protein YfcA [Rhodococcus sp. SORGH_AS_0301]